LAEKAVKKLQNFLVDDHAIKLSLSTKAVTAQEKANEKAKVLKKRTHDEAEVPEEDASVKLMVKNLAFECTADEVREMFKPYGILKKVRLPKKVNSQNHRGFGFVEFATKEEAI
jgi:multiple RNA-binding domain-containing protein 1